MTIRWRSYILLALLVCLLPGASSRADEVFLERDELYSVAWSPDGQRIAASGVKVFSDGTLQDYLYLWDGVTGRFLADLNARPDRHNGRILYLRWQDDRRQLLSAGLDQLFRWSINDADRDLPAAYLIQKWGNRHAQPVFITGLDWQKNNISLVMDGELQLWQWAGTKYSLNRTQPGQYFSVALDPTGTRLAVNHQLGTQILNLDFSPVQIPGQTTAPYIEALPSFDDLLNQPDVTSLSTAASAWSADGTKLAVSYVKEQVIRIWNVETGEILQTIDAGYAAETLLWNPDQFRLVSAKGDRVDVWDTFGGTSLAAYFSPGKVGNSTTLSWDPSGSRLIYPSLQAGTAMPPIVTPPVAPAAASDTAVTPVR